jgi:hypothetical protein
LREIRKPIYWVVIGALVIVPLIAGLLTFRDYGESLDESHLYAYSEYSLQAYRGFFSIGFDPDLGKGNFRYYGPAFLMGANLFTHLLDIFTNNLFKMDAWHLAYFLTFQACVLGFYFLAKRWLSRPAALATSLLFLLQPLLWGHAFINPKDIPFMAFFLFSILTGLVMQEKLFPVALKWDLPSFAQIKQEWRLSEMPDRKKVILFSCIAFALLALFILGQNGLADTATNLIKAIYASSPQSISGRLFAFFAQNYRNVPVELYTVKLLKLVNGVLGILIVCFLVLAIFLLRRIFPEALSFLSSQSFRKFFKDAFDYLRNPAVLLTGLMLGLTISVRIISPFAGIIVLVIAFNRAKSKVLPALLAYFIIALFVMYLTWPYLWPDPIGRFKTSLFVMSEFPWDGKVLFNGTYYQSDQLPVSYVPGLFGLQFTEPVVLLFIIGLCIFTYRIWKHAINIDYSLLVIIWGLLPFIAFTILRPSLYDNFRQLFFIVPPLFMVVGLALEKLFQYIKNWYLQVSVIILFLLAGVLPIIHLHPYQYVYYNAFTGGLRGASRQFEADYWGTSSREAIEYINQIAPENTRLIVFAAGNIDRVERYARPDLIIDSINNARFDLATGYDYAIVSTRGDRDLKNFTDWRTLYIVERDSNVFAIVKQKPTP